LAPVPIFFGALEDSLKAAMIFPRERERAKACAAWLILRSIVASREKGFGGMYDAGLDSKGAKQILLDLACSASDFAYLYNDAVQNSEDGIRAGIVVACLWALICANRHTASWERAIETAERYTARSNARSKKKLPATRTLFRDCLTRFAPVLHLLGARTLRRNIRQEENAVDNIIDLRPDQSVGYSRKTDLLFFVAEARALQQELRSWDRDRSPRSELLNKEMLDFGKECWIPPPREQGWPDRGRLKEFKIEPAIEPIRAAPGRPRKTLSK
jgi:hypothetical protein